MILSQRSDILAFKPIRNRSERHSEVLTDPYIRVVIIAQMIVDGHIDSTGREAGGYYLRHPTHMRCIRQPIADALPRSSTIT